MKKISSFVQNSCYISDFGKNSGIWKESRLLSGIIILS